MNEETKQNLMHMENHTNKIFERVHPILDNGTKMTITDMKCLSEIMRNCSSVYKNLAKVYSVDKFTKENDVML